MEMLHDAKLNEIFHRHVDFLRKDKQIQYHNEYVPTRKTPFTEENFNAKNEKSVTKF